MDNKNSSSIIVQIEHIRKNAPQGQNARKPIFIIKLRARTFFYKRLTTLNQGQAMRVYSSGRPHQPKSRVLNPDARQPQPYHRASCPLRPTRNFRTTVHWLPRLAYVCVLCQQKLVHCLGRLGPVTTVHTTSSPPFPNPIIFGTISL